MYRSSKVKRTVSESTASTFVMWSSQLADDQLISGALQTPWAKTTSSAVNGSPSCQVMPGWMWNVTCSESSLNENESARPGRKWMKSGSDRIRYQ